MLATVSPAFIEQIHGKIIETQTPVWSGVSCVLAHLPFFFLLLSNHALLFWFFWSGLLYLPPRQPQIPINVSIVWKSSWVLTLNSWNSTWKGLTASACFSTLTTNIIHLTSLPLLFKLFKPLLLCFFNSLNWGFFPICNHWIPLTSMQNENHFESA